MTSACATSFTGSAHIEDGRTGCEAKCSGQGLTMTGLVYLGEYSSACVCSVDEPGAPGIGGVSMSGVNDSAAASAAGGAAGVIMQMREAEESGAFVVQVD